MFPPFVHALSFSLEEGAQTRRIPLSEASKTGFGWALYIGDGPNTVSESTVSNTEPRKFFCPYRVPGRELSEFLSAYYLCAKANSESSSFSRNSPSLPQNSVSSLLRNSTLETVFRPFPITLRAGKTYSLNLRGLFATSRKCLIHSLCGNRLQNPAQHPHRVPESCATSNKHQQRRRGAAKPEGRGRGIPTGR